MRKKTKKQLLELVLTIQQATNDIEKVAKEEDSEGLYNYLAECQNAAVSVGNTIEKTEGENAESIKDLSLYCEMLYEYSMGNKTTISEMVDVLVRVANAIEKIEPMLEVVFIPYKASMWDSLESIWLAARNDPRCNPVVVPIPYYDKTPNRQLGQEHYEIDLYPDYVPVVRYDEYDFATNTPDIIFFHNPYDEFNYVTSVHPFFYSKNIRKYTDKIVYVPYYVLDENEMESGMYLNKMKHFFTVSGVVYADMVIVQSESVKKAYIEALIEWLGEEKVRNMGFEKKILGLGSPKFDKVLNTQRDEESIPQKWKKVMKDDKKVILYNTSVSALIRDKDRALEKIRISLETFKNRTDIVLLWRPHPLIKATIGAMYPYLCAEYEKIVQEYIEEGWGIYDDTPDMNRAIAISDAYYGDSSSLVPLYESLGKPILLQNNHIE